MSDYIGDLDHENENHIKNTWTLGIVNCMPTCYITLSEIVRELTDSEIEKIRDIVAEGLTSNQYSLNRDHVVVRVLNFRRRHMLGDIELEIFGQFLLRRALERDYQANNISRRISQYLKEQGIDHPKGCATWIHMVTMGYCRVTPKGKVFYSGKSNQPHMMLDF
jgi:hypothetical protein